MNGKILNYLDMTPKKKATELVNRFYQEFDTGFTEIDKQYAKQCAKICIVEIIQSDPTNPRIGRYFETTSDMVDSAVDYWNEVRIEIEKL